MRLTIAAALVSLVAAHHATAQNVVVINNANRPPVTAERLRTVTMTFQMTMPSPVMSSSEDITKAVAATNQSLLDIINHECSVLTATLKGNCRLSRLNVGGNFNETNFNPLNLPNRGTVSPAVSANANATFEINSEPSAADAAPSPAGAPKQ